MKPEDWETVTRNMYGILKPGGWLQWLEPDLAQACYWSRLDPKAPSSSEEVADLLLPLFQCFEVGRKELAGIFRRVGFQNVVHEKMSSDRIPGTRPAWAECNAGPMYQALLMIEQSKGSNGYSPEQCANLIDRLRAEADAGVIYSRFDLHLFVGQRV